MVKGSSSPTERIRAALETGRTITPIEALEEFGCFRLAARVKDLRDAGYPVQTVFVTDGHTGKRYAAYRRGWDFWQPVELKLFEDTE